MSQTAIKVAVTGAAGNIGYALLFRIASGQAFGADVPVELSLLEITPAMSALEGVVMELEDCAFPLLKSINISDDPSAAFKNVNWSVLVGSVPRKQGMERKDLLKINGGIFTGQGKAINDNAASDVKTFVVGNPCNTNCLIAMNAAKDIPNDQFFAMTMLDENRAKAQLANKAGVGVDEIDNMIIWGNHSSTQFPDFAHANISNKLATDVINDKAWLEGEFIKTVQQRGAAIIKARGASSAASAANAVIDTMYNITHDTAVADAYSVATCSKGAYGVDEGLIFSFPTRTENGEVKIIEGIEHDVFGQEKFQATLEELRSERDAVKDLGLIE